MDVKIGSRWEGLIAEAVASGRYASPEDVVSEALYLLAQREWAELKQSLRDAIEEGGAHTDEQVAANVRERLAARTAAKAAE